MCFVIGAEVAPTRYKPKEANKEQNEQVMIKLYHIDDEEVCPRQPSEVMYLNGEQGRVRRYLSKVHT